MASAFHLFPPPPNSRPLRLPSRQNFPASTIPLCSSTARPNPSNDDEEFDETLAATTSTSFAIEKRIPSVILRRRSPSTAIERSEPPNFEIGWKRTKEIKTEKPKGWAIADFLEKLEGLMTRGRWGSAALLAKTAEIVAERAREEAEVLRAAGEVEDRVVTELFRVLKLMEMDVEMVKAAVKEETLKERIETARARCRQAILVALSF
ncbi:protein CHLORORESPIRATORY REDUCTION 41, chloroplastic [Typha latifolia]|uniref:protein CHLORORESPIRATORY REDUCTION 41, chloroplastic n=1 Tax=Typha latifolia TaxID=4733 RepID=UPI003C2D16B9